jgi:hypothetical protein
MDEPPNVQPAAPASPSLDEPYPYAPRPADPLPPGITEDRWLAEHRPQFNRLPAGTLALAGLYIAVSLACLFVIPLTRVFQQRDLGALLVYSSGGMICGGAGLLAAWITWGPPALQWRLLLSWGVALTWLVAWLIGAETSGSWLDWDDVQFALLSLPLFGLAIQLPLWVLRAIWGWRLVKAAGERAGTPEPALSDEPILTHREGREPPLTIRKLMLATVIVAVSFAAARVAGTQQTNSDYWLAWSIVLASVAGVSLVSIPVAAALNLRLRPAMGIALTVGYAILASCVTVFCVTLFSRGRVRSWEMFCLGVVLCALGVTLAWGALAARKLGYALATSRQSG